MTAVLTMAVE